ncbi:hypothetical protein D3C85_1540210 [compost metagenome]
MHQRRNLDGFGLEFLAPGKRQHALGQRYATQGALGGVVHQPGNTRVVTHALADYFQIAEDHRQQVVEIVGNASGELADGLHLLRLEQRLAGLFEDLLGLGGFGDVTGDLGKTE